MPDILPNITAYIQSPWYGTHSILCLIFMLLNEYKWRSLKWRCLNHTVSIIQMRCTYMQNPIIVADYFHVFSEFRYFNKWIQVCYKKVLHADWLHLPDCLYHLSNKLFQTTPKRLVFDEYWLSYSNMALNMYRWIVACSSNDCASKKLEPVSRACFRKIKPERLLRESKHGKHRIRSFSQTFVLR